MAAILRDSSAGQLARLFLGIKIAPYEDEKEGFALSQTQSKPTAQPPTTTSRDHSPDDASEKDLEKEDSDKDVEKDVPNADHVAPPPAHPEDPNIIGWIGPNDEDNPQNWSSGKKFFTYAQICLLTFASMCICYSLARQSANLNNVVYSASAIVTPAAGDFIRIFGITQQVTSLSLSMYVLGYVSTAGLLPPCYLY